jgi:hypothetical protein
LKPPAKGADIPKRSSRASCALRNRNLPRGKAQPSMML